MVDMGQKKGIKKWFSDTMIYAFFYAAFSKPKASLAILCLDAVFILLLVLTNIVFGKAIGNYVYQAATSGIRIVPILGFLAVVIVEILIYSACKNLVLNRIMAYQKKVSFGFKAYSSFFWLNISYVSSCILIFFIYSMIMMPITPANKNMAFSVFFVLIAFLLYAYVFISLQFIHASFFRDPDRNIIKTLLDGFLMTFEEIVSVLRIIFNSILLFITYLIGFAIFGVLWMLFLGFDAEKLAAANPTYETIILVMTSIALYIIINFFRYSLITHIPKKK
ncbi:hypothetical protein COT47_02560 [Candidatus Woesearchaeota archaeon CG08_land_8_20_14_0_20_43_7]|nr:MAG: hypothetical protein COT47_02560 [Candidatus Woesearchaeota archaeon CG08_land_8_20_14_0_20_43_7]